MFWPFSKLVKTRSETPKECRQSSEPPPYDYPRHRSEISFASFPLHLVDRLSPPNDVPPKREDDNQTQ